jgi:hypothetical protein
MTKAKHKHIPITLPNGTTFSIKVFTNIKTPDSVNILISSAPVKVGDIGDMEINGDVAFNIRPLSPNTLLIEGKSNLFGDTKRLNDIFKKDKKKATIITEKIKRLQTRKIV